MSDGALSQDEIDSLLAGLDPSAGGSPSSKASASGASANDLRAFGGIMAALADTHAQTVSMMTGKDATFSPPTVDGTTRDGMLPSLPDEVLAVKVDMVGGIPGDHLFLVPKDASIKIASLANQDETLSELDDMAISVVSECISSLTGSAINAFTEKSGNRSIQSDVADGAFGPKAIARFPAGDFVRVSYEFTVDGSPYKMWEIYSMGFVKDIVAASGMQAPAQQPMGAQGGMSGGQAPMGGQMPMGQPMGGMQMGGMQMGGQMGYQQPMYQQQMMAPQGMYQSPIMGQPNVQPVQFANLGLGNPGQESGNIGLIMDVFMELTVELGRTKKLIKDILGIGEGTIIELDKLAGEPVDILVNHKLIAKGEVVVIDENFGVRVTEIVSPMERMADLS
ncbi:MAG: flagellar motor switch protein FliN [Spirochaetaceae bacterium]|nr:flagellar motor switch protein FliN [Spirochaetaceae bacterium]